MSEIIDVLIQRLADLSGIEYFTFAFNIFVYLFSNSIVSHHRDIDEDTIKSRTRILHWFNLLVFISFIASLVLVDEEFFWLGINSVYFFLHTSLDIST